jgi:hypothetical protein
MRWVWVIVASWGCQASPVPAVLHVRPAVSQELPARVALASVCGDLEFVGERASRGRHLLVMAAEKARLREPYAVREMHSSGERELDESVLNTRRAFADADAARLLGLAWLWTGQEPYAQAAVGRLTHWADTYVPTGHPINETRLEGLVMAYPMVRDRMDAEQEGRVRAFLKAIRAAKESWEFGDLTAVNNHRTHQIKMLRLLDEVLGSGSHDGQLQQKLEQHLTQSIDGATGLTHDLIERDALYYHVYALEAWLEIAWVDGTVPPSVDLAVRHLMKRLEANELDGEFEDSSSSLDAIRGRAGFGYGTAGSRFDPARARRVLWTHAALTGEPVSPEVADLLSSDPEVNELYYWLRNELCSPRP